MLRSIDVGTSVAATLTRLGSGIRVGSLGPRPPRPLRLYEFEGCPFCRKVREALTVLDLEVEIRPCPKGGQRFRPEVVRRGGKAQFPYLVDPNSGKEMYESDDIIAYLFAEYGVGGVPARLGPGFVNTATAALAGLWRAGKGIRAHPSRAPEQPLELYSFEGSPFCRIVREQLCSLELPYLLHNIGKGSKRRAGFVERSGRLMVPYLADPNANIEMFESRDIVAYLERVYGAPGRSAS